MSKAGKVSRQLLQFGRMDVRKSEPKKSEAESRWDRLFSLRRNSRSKSQCNGAQKKVSPAKEGFLDSRGNRRRRTVSEIVINVLESDSENDCNMNCETELNNSVSESNNERSEGCASYERKSGKARSLDESPISGAFQRTSRQSTFDEKITPIGRLLVPVRKEGETEVETGGSGFNSLFISPEGPLDNDLDSAAEELSRIERIKKWFEPAETNVNLKIFGGDRGLAKEKQRMKAFGFLIHPYSAFRNFWDLVVLLLLVSNMIILPVTITFFREDLSPVMVMFNVVSDICFMADICLNFRTGYMAPGAGVHIILKPKLIAKRYLRTWFWLDFISSLPFDYILSSATGDSDGIAVKGASRALKFLRLAKLLSLLKLLRISRILRYIKQCEEIFHMTTSFMRYIKLIAMMLLVAHWNGCLGFLVPMLQDFPDDCWVTINNLKDAEWTVQYSWALFKALSHMLCIGYGRYPPATLSEAYITIFSMITGATFYALFIAHSMAYIQHVDSARRQYAEKFKQVEEYMTYRSLPDHVKERLSNYYEHRYQGKMFNEEQILGEISRPLKEEIVSHNCRDLVDAVPFFKNGSALFVRKVLTLLRFEVFLPGDYIIREGTFGTEMYFIRQGSVDILVNGERTTTLNEGNYFGEICLLANARRITSAKAASVCDLFVLPAASFKNILEEFPDVKVLVEHVAIHKLLDIRKQVRLQTGSTEAADDLLFGSGLQRRWSIVQEPFHDDTVKEDSTPKIYLRRQSMKDFVMNRKESNCIDGCSLEHLVETHRKGAESCILCQEDLTKVDLTKQSL
eukprot:gene6316-11743_t